MLLFIYFAAQVVELTLGLYFAYRLYPQLRREAKWVKGVMACVYVVLCMVYAWNAWGSYISTLTLVLNSIVFSLVYCIFFRAEYITVLLGELMFYINIGFIRLPILIVQGLFNERTLAEVNQGERNIVEALWCWAMNVLFIFIMRWVARHRDIIRQLLREQSKLLGVMAVMQWWLLIYNMWLGEQGFQTIDLVVNIILIVCGVLTIQCLLLYVVYQKGRSENRLLSAVHEQIQKHNRALQEVFECNARKMHDTKHVFIYMASCLKQGEIEKVENCIDDYLGVLEKTDSQIWTSSPFLDYLLNYKKFQMDEKGILLQLDVDFFQCPLKEEELGIVLGNLLDNAIEAAENCKTEQKEIDINIWNRDDIFCIKIKNSCSDAPKLVNGQFVTRKTDKNEHGWGIANVKHIVEIYDGTIQFKFDNAHFEVNIII